MIRHTSINHNPQTIVWHNKNLVDWTFAGKVYTCLDESKKDLGRYSYSSFDFDSAISSDSGEYICLYQRLGTKGILLKNGNLIREINRSYYYANTYEYPVAFATLSDGSTILIHCPNRYCQLDFEDVETGKALTSHIYREPMDFFHSRLEVSPDNKYLLSKGWIWQPFDYIAAYNIEECIKNPLLLDKWSYQKPASNGDINTACFINNNKVLIGTDETVEAFDEDDKDLLNPGQIAIWDIENNEVKDIKHIDSSFGNLFTINENYAWDFYKFPKIIDLRTGQIVDQIENFNSGNQNSSIIHHLPNLPTIVYNKKSKAVAIKTDKSIEIFEFES
jgi:hypothetical protein